MLRIGCRTAHIGSAALILGAAYYHQLDALDWWALPVLAGSGIIIVLDDFYRRGRHLLRMAQFWILVCKLLLLGLAIWNRDLLLPALWGSLIIGSIVSHVPGFIRHHELWGATPKS